MAKDFIEEADVVEEAEAKLDAKAAKREAAVQAYKDAQDLVRTSYPTIKDALEGALDEDEAKELFAALVKVVGNKKGSGAPRVAGAKRVSLNSQIAEMFAEVGTKVSDFALFKAFKVGAERMRWFIIASIKDAKDPEERMWVRYIPDEEVYELVAIGADVPEGWDGYLPKDESLL